jgi:hypothetical protein
MTDLNKSTLEHLLQKMVESGVDMSQYRKSPTKLVVPAHMLVAAQKVFGDSNDYEMKVDFND